MLRNLPVAHSQNEGILTQCGFQFARIDSLSQQGASVLMTRFGTFKADLRVGSRHQLLTLARKVEFVIPAPSTLRSYRQIQAPANSDFSRMANRLDISNEI